MTPSHALETDLARPYPGAIVRIKVKSSTFKARTIGLQSEAFENPALIYQIDLAEAGFIELRLKENLTPGMHRVKGWDYVALPGTRGRQSIPYAFETELIVYSRTDRDLS